jgi:hypothetical protein
MRRIITILILAVLLLPQAPHDKRLPPAMSGLNIHVQPLALDSSHPERRAVGALTLLGAWALTSKNALFGGISSMHVADDGGILALSDGGVLFGFDVDGRSGRRPFVASLPVRAGERDWPMWKWDSEALQYDAATGRYWVGFELIQRICRYAPALARVESCASPPALRAWPDVGSVEALARLPDGRFIAFSEMGFGPHGGNDVLLFQGDPADAATPAPAHLGYIPPQGYKPTDAVWLGKNRLLVLNRRVTPYDGFTAVLALVELPELKEAVVLRAQAIARFAPPILADNFEALALSHEKGRTIVWIASDDNHMYFQRSLLLKLALPAELDPLRPGIHLLY